MWTRRCSASSSVTVLKRARPTTSPPSLVACPVNRYAALRTGPAPAAHAKRAPSETSTLSARTITLGFHAIGTRLRFILRTVRRDEVPGDAIAEFSHGLRFLESPRYLAIHRAMSLSAL